jgi:hypothetical protein
MFRPDLPTKTLYAPFLSPVPNYCPVQLILPGLITQILFREEYRS